MSRHPFGTAGYVLLFVVGILSITVHAAIKEADSGVETVTVTPKDMPMIGPSAIKQIQFEGDRKSDSGLLWITGYEVDLKYLGRTASEFLCHSILHSGGEKLDLANPHTNQGLNAESDSRRKSFKKIFVQNHLFFTLSPGLTAASFPEGFGIPIRSDEVVSAETMAQMPTRKSELSKASVAMKAKVHYATEEKSHPMHALARYSIFTSVAAAAHSEAHCAQAPSWEDQAPTNGYFYHWLVPPGRHVFKSQTTSFPFNTTIHAVIPHLHAFAESIELFDETAHSSVLKMAARTNSNGEVEKIDTFSSEKGVPVFADHKYQVIAVYNNTTPENVDAMGVMHTYILDTTFNN